MHTLIAWAHAHLLPVLVGSHLFVVALARLDSLIKLALRFVPADVLKAELRRVETKMEARVDQISQPPAK